MIFNLPLTLQWEIVGLRDSCYVIKLIFDILHRENMLNAFKLLVVLLIYLNVVLSSELLENLWPWYGCGCLVKVIRIFKKIAYEFAMIPVQIFASFSYDIQYD